MATVIGEVEAVSTKYDKFSILVDGTWYATKQEWAPSPAPNKGDQVTFDNGGKKYIKKLSIMNSGGGGGSSPSYSGGASRGGYSNLGVEVGHASNLAMRMMEQGVEAVSSVGTEEYYKQFMKYTHDMYRLMKGIRKSIEAEDAATTSLAAEKAGDHKPYPEKEEDIF